MLLRLFHVMMQQVTRLKGRCGMWDLSSYTNRFPCMYLGQITVTTSFTICVPMVKMHKQAFYGFLPLSLKWRLMSLPHGSQKSFV